MRDLSSKRLIVAKGLMFLALAGMAASLLFWQAPSLGAAALMAVLVWASCRFYYFLFYALERYAGPGLRYAGLLALFQQIRRARGATRLLASVAEVVANAEAVRPKSRTPGRD